MAGATGAKQKPVTNILARVGEISKPSVKCAIQAAMRAEEGRSPIVTAHISKTLPHRGRVDGTVRNSRYQRHHLLPRPKFLNPRALKNAGR